MQSTVLHSYILTFCRSLVHDVRILPRKRTMRHSMTSIYEFSGKIPALIESSRINNRRVRHNKGQPLLASAIISCVLLSSYPTWVCLKRETYFDFWVPESVTSTFFGVADSSGARLGGRKSGAIFWGARESVTRWPFCARESGAAFSEIGYVHLKLGARRRKTGGGRIFRKSSGTQITST